MSDRIKKIKIKQSDGTFSDYIPIGADAKNIDTTRGESVQSVIDKTARYYNSIAEMKLDDNIQVGDTCVTLGYYEVNDGGGATYKIIDNTDKKYSIDNSFVLQLNNSLIAVIVIITNQISLLQIGGKPQKLSTVYDNKQYFEAYQNQLSSGNFINFSLFIPKGVFGLSETILVGENLSIIGSSNFENSSQNYGGSFLVPVNDNQNFILQFGDPNSYTTGLNLDKIIFSSLKSLYTSEKGKIYTINYQYNTVTNALIIRNVIFANIGTIYFRHIKGGALLINRSWELIINELNLRAIDNIEGNLITLGEGADVYNTVNASMFFNIIVEATHGNVIKVNSYCYNNTINNICFEDYVFNAEEKYEIKNKTNFPDMNEENTFHHAILKLGQNGQWYGCILNNINFNNFSNYTTKYNEKYYTYDRIVDLDEGTGSGVYIGIIDNIIFDNGNGSSGPQDIDLIYSHKKVMSISAFVINNVITNNAVTKPIVNIENFPYIRVNNLKQGFNSSKKINQYTEAYKNALTYSNYANSTMNLLLYDKDSISDIKLAVMIPNNGERRAIEDRKIGGDTLKIRAKTKNGNQSHLEIYSNSKSVSTIISGTSYQWYSIDLSEIPEDTYIDFRGWDLSSEDNVIIDAYYFK